MRLPTHSEGPNRLSAQSREAWALRFRLNWPKFALIGHANRRFPHQWYRQNHPLSHESKWETTPNIRIFPTSVQCGFSHAQPTQRTDHHLYGQSPHFVRPCLATRIFGYAGERVKKLVAAYERAGKTALKRLFF